MRYLAYVALVFFAIAATPAHAIDIVGIPIIVDGDTVEIAGKKIRLEGIDALETDQICIDANGERWSCGITARDQLNQKAGGKLWKCHVGGTDRYRRSLASCEVDGININQWIVANGWALSFVRYSHQYDADEETARKGNLGLWDGAFRPCLASPRPAWPCLAAPGLA